MNTVAEIKERDLQFYRRYHRNQIFNEIAGYFAALAAKGEITKSEIAKRLNKHPSQITNWLTEPANVSIDTISDLLVAMDAAMDLEVRAARHGQPSVDAAESFERQQASAELTDLAQQQGRMPARGMGGGRNTKDDEIVSAA